MPSLNISGRVGRCRLDAAGALAAARGSRCAAAAHAQRHVARVAAPAAMQGAASGAIPTNITWHEGGVSAEQKEALLGQKGVVLWFTG